MSREVQITMTVIVDDEYAKYVTVDEDGKVFLWRDKPTRIPDYFDHTYGSWYGNAFKKCKVKGWDNLCIELKPNGGNDE